MGSQIRRIIDAGRRRPSTRRFQRTWCALVVLICGLSRMPAFAQEPEERQLVQLSVRIDTHYNDDPAALKRLQELLVFLPPQADTLRAKENIEQFVVRRYGFGPYKQPDARKAYYLIRDEIARRNGGRHIAGPRNILVPPLPHRQVLHPNLSKLTNRLPQLQMFALLPDQKLDAITQIENVAREGSRTYVATIRMSREDVRARQDQSLFSSDAVSVDHELFVAAAGDNAACITPRTDPLFLPGEEALIRQRVASARHSIYLFVLDSSWPSDPELQASINLVRKALKQWREDLSLPAATMDAPTFKNPPPTLAHSTSVAESLRELRSFDPTGRAVQVVYLPITIQQDTFGFFRNLLEVSFVASRAGTLGHRPVKASALYGRAVADTTNVLADINTELTANPNAFTSNKAVLDALYRLADYMASGQNTLYFVNTSWGVPATLLKFTPVSERGITVVATGNHDEEFPGNETDFARRCVKDRSFIGAVNMSRAGGRLCCSGRIKSTYEQKAVAIGFDGIITSDCGTSYAAPRLAFLLALAAAQGSTPDLASWYLDLEDRARPHGITEALSITNLLKEP